MNTTPVLVLLLALAVQCQAHSCSVQNCWDSFFQEAGICRDKVPELKSCIDNADLCGCEPDEVVDYMEVNGDAACGDSKAQLLACESPKARACFQTAIGIMQILYVQPPPPIAERKAMVAAFDSCIDKAIKSKESLKGCEYFFPTPGDMAFALSYAFVRGWAQGCDDSRKLAESCGRLAVPRTLNDCNGGRDPLGESISCLKDEAKDKPVCLEFVSQLPTRLAPVKEEACAKLQEAQKQIYAACGSSRRKLVRRFLRLLNDDQN